ncbi:MAG TPA: radical SAM protein, partial [Deltaproteobacteria bacterium]|nr:radical SAM protein [Deltaproteobacteria bacterium]
LQNCAEAKIAVQLVPTLIPGVNTHQTGAIIRYAKQWIPVVKGVHFQPVSYFGRYPSSPADEQRVTLPEVLQALEDQTAGEIKAANFLPRRRSDSHCGFSGFFVLDEDNTLLPTTFFQPQEPSCSRCSDIQGRPDPSEHFRRFIQERSVYVEPLKEDTGAMNELDRFYQRSHSHYLSISGMPFQDVWTLDLERLQGCCIHVISPVTRRLIPFCAYYLTSSSGQRLPGKGFLPGP